MFQQAGLPAIPFPIGVGAYDVNGQLTAVPNAPSDDLALPDSNRRSHVLKAPRDPLVCTACGSLTADSQFVFALLRRAMAYGNDLTYNPTPFSGGGYNSNSFGQGLINAP